MKKGDNIMKKTTWKKRDSEFKTFLEREEFLFKDFSGVRTRSISYKIKNLDKAADTIRYFIKNNFKIRAVCDYDVDGMTSAAELELGFKDLRAIDFETYLPKRFSDGYGISSSIIDKFLPKLNPDEEALLITADNGIAAIDALSYAKELGWTIIILDHHLPVTDDKGNLNLPPADIIIDPHAIKGSANFDDYCGAGLIFKLFQSMKEISESTMKKITSLAMIGTICDCVNLIRPIGGSFSYDNYLIVKEGLDTVLQNDGRTTGLYCLLRSLGYDYNISTDAIGFTVGPTMNAASRLNDDGATDVKNLIVKDDNKFSEAEAIVTELIATNDLRKSLTLSATETIDKTLTEEEKEQYPLVYVTDKEDIGQGLLGLVANKIVENYNTIGIVFTPVGNLYKGSSRIPENAESANIKLLLDGCKDLLVSYGGHKPAAGLCIKKENLKTFIERIQELAGDKPDELFCEYYDYEITPQEADEILAVMEKYAPFGEGHKTPVVKVSDYHVDKTQILGKESKVCKLIGKNEPAAINFTGYGVEAIDNEIKTNILNVYGKVTANEWKGNKITQVVFSHIEDSV